MRVLWIVNVVFPEVCPAFGLPETVIGGWLSSYRRALKQRYSDISLYVVSPYVGNVVASVELDGDFFFVFPQSFGDKLQEDYFSMLYNKVNPDAVHIHGTELHHSLSYVRACGIEHTVVSIQGLASVYTRYYMAGIKTSEWIASMTFRDLVKCDTIYNRLKAFKARGRSEVELIGKVDNFAGRTSWDKSNLLAINPNARYFKLWEVLRAPFYVNEWSLASCHRHSIFLSQVYMPLKGLHIMLRALPLILHKFPDTQVYVCGEDYSLKPAYRRDGFWNYIARLIDRCGLRSHLHFLGSLDENKMAEQYLSANVFVCPSSIENSSNSVCEAQILGTPVVASYVGGMMDLIEDGVTGLLYRFEEHTMLAHKVCSIFEDDSLAQNLSAAARRVALERHDPAQIADSLYAIYHNIGKEKQAWEK